MKCIDCINYQKTSNIEAYDFKNDRWVRIYCCPHGKDWVEEDNDANELCDNKFKQTVEMIGYVFLKK